MIAIPFSSLPFKKQYLLRKSPLNPPMYGIIEGHHYDDSLNVVFYDVQIGIQKNQDVICSMIKLRYSELEHFQKTLMNCFQDIENLKEFPPKRWFFNTNESFINEREKGLQKFLSMIFEIPSITETDTFKSFFKLKKLVSR